MYVRKCGAAIIFTYRWCSGAVFVWNLSNALWWLYSDTYKIGFEPGRRIITSYYLIFHCEIKFIFYFNKIKTNATCGRLKYSIQNMLKLI